MADKATDDRLRRYDSWVASRNLSNQASDASVQALVDAVVDRYDIPQRWYRLKAQLLGVDRLADYDRNSSIADVDVEFTWSEATEIVLDAYGSFSGELAYEIGVPSGYGEALAAALMAAGSDLGVMPYGLEAMSVMRIEKGHVAGAELNGQTTAADLGLGKMVSTKKDFIGRTMAQRPALTDPDRPTLVGFRTVNAADRVTSGAHFLDTGAAPTMANDLGHITSVAFSPAEGRWIGLGLMVRGPQRIGERVRAWDDVRNRDVPIELCAPCFYDPAGARLRG